VSDQHLKLGKKPIVKNGCTKEYIEKEETDKES